MSSGYRQLDAAGNKQLKSGGATLLVDAGEACCCECESYCPSRCDRSPTAVVVTTSGINICLCFNDNDDHSWETEWFIDVNTVWNFTLSDRGSTCEWEKTLVNVGRTRFHASNTTCTAASPGSWSSIDLELILLKNSNEWFFTINVIISGGGAPDLFHGSSAVVGLDCESAVTITNTMTSYDCGAIPSSPVGLALGGEGTALIEPSEFDCP